MINDEWGGVFDWNMFNVVCEQGGEIVVMDNGEGDRDKGVVEEMVV